MAKLYSLAGALIRLLKTEDEEIAYGAPCAFDAVLEFDGDTNQEVLRKLDTNWQAHRLTAGKLYRDDVPVTIQQPGELYLDREYLRGFWSDLNNAITFTGNARDAWPGMNSAQKQAWLANNFDTVLRIIHGILRFTRWLVRAWMQRPGL